MVLPIAGLPRIPAMRVGRAVPEELALADSGPARVSMTGAGPVDLSLGVLDQRVVDLLDEGGQGQVVWHIPGQRGQRSDRFTVVGQQQHGEGDDVAVERIDLVLLFGPDDAPLGRRPDLAQDFSG